MNHTPEPWKYARKSVEYREGQAAAHYGHHVSCDQHAKPGVVSGCDSIAEVRGHDDMEARANAIRIVACVNGCAGLNPAAYREVVEAGRVIDASIDEEGKFTGHVPSAAEFLALKQALAHAEQQL